MPHPIREQGTKKILLINYKLIQKFPVYYGHFFPPFTLPNSKIEYLPSKKIYLHCCSSLFPP